MKVNKEIVEKRRNEVMKIIQERNSISVDDLVSLFNVSAITIRRDLQFWEDKGAIERYYGGASLLQAFIDDDVETYQRNRYMKAIAKRAQAFIEDGDVIFINSSITAITIINYLKDKNVTIITNNALAINYHPDPKITILFTGGELRFPKKSITGDLALATINSITANKCFIGCSGLTKDSVSSGHVKEAHINKAMINRTKGKKFLLCDHTKIGINHSFDYAKFSDCDYLITDILADENIISYINDHNNIKILKVDALKYNQ